MMEQSRQYSDNDMAAKDAFTTFLMGGTSNLRSHDEGTRDEYRLTADLIDPDDRGDSGQKHPVRLVSNDNTWQRALTRYRRHQ